MRRSFVSGPAAVRRLELAVCFLADRLKILLFIFFDQVTLELASEVDEGHPESLHVGLFIDDALVSLLLFSVLSNLLVQLVNDLAVGLPKGLLETRRRFHDIQLLLGSNHGIASSIAGRAFGLIALQREELLLVSQVSEPLDPVELLDKLAILLLVVNWVQLALGNDLSRVEARFLFARLQLASFSANLVHKQLVIERLEDARVGPHRVGLRL